MNTVCDLNRCNGCMACIEKCPKQCISIPEFFASNPLEKVEELLEDDYGMIDGIINNGSRKDEELTKKPSVLEKLEEKSKKQL